MYPLLWWLPYGEFLTMFNGRRVVAVTDRSITVLKAGRMRWNHNRPTKVMYSVPRTTAIGPFTKRWAHATIGSEQVWLQRNAYQFLERALAAPASADPQLPQPQGSA